jgi:hypothetical protein
MRPRPVRCAISSVPARGFRQVSARRRLPEKRRGDACEKSKVRDAVPDRLEPPPRRRAGACRGIAETPTSAGVYEVQSANRTLAAASLEVSEP